MSEQMSLFQSQAEIDRESREAAVEAWWAAREWRGRYRCPVCGRSERTRFAYQLGHDFAPAGWLLLKGQTRTWCSSRHLSTRQALWGLRQDDPWIWQAASMDLRKMAAALQGARR